jgi:hypothetical protein
LAFWSDFEMLLLLLSNDEVFSLENQLPNVKTNEEEMLEIAKFKQTEL